MTGQLALGIGLVEPPGAALWDGLPPDCQAEVILRLAGILARLMEAGRDD